ncbi:MAG: helix-turn-helix domain-containing protein [Verrucomicrobia bacterium]|nr:helix-turn-helix domain-containing protein [Verrucomicrobiota bacterium]
MDSLITAAARALAAGDALGALKRVSLRQDPPALALRGIALAQLGDYPRARVLLRRAARGFGPNESLARARCAVAEAEVALAMRDLTPLPRGLTSAVGTLEAQQDRANALRGQLIGVRRCLLLGRIDEALALLAPLDIKGIPPALKALAELTAAELSLRLVRVASARAALDRAQVAAFRSGIAALQAEVTEAFSVLDQGAARLLEQGREQSLRLSDVEVILSSGDFIVDGCRRAVRVGAEALSLARRPVLFALIRALAEAWPEEVSRRDLIETGFHCRRPDDSHRVRLRVELGRLRRLLVSQARIEATADGFILVPQRSLKVVVLAPPMEGERASVVALLADGAAWSTSSLALALATSQRTAQRVLLELEQSGLVRSMGRARSRRWLARPLSGFTTTLLLPTLLPSG